MADSFVLIPLLVMMLVLIFAGVPIAYVTGVTSLIGLVMFMGVQPALSLAFTTSYETVANYTMIVLPLFILMGSFVLMGEIALPLYVVASHWMRAVPGALAIATSGAMTAFGAATGSGIASVMAFGRISVPAMVALQYHPRLALGVVAASGPIAMLIPPSVALVLYGMITGQSIVRLFVAGVVPGVLEFLTFSALIILWVKIDPSVAPRPAQSVFFREKLRSLSGVLPLVTVILFVMGGIYSGKVTITESAGFGAIGALIVALIAKGRRLKLSEFSVAVSSSTRTTAVLLLLLITGSLFSRLIALTGVTDQAAGYIETLGVSRWWVIFLLVALYQILGTMLDGSSIIILMVPITYPIAMQAGFDPIWFGIFVVKMIEMGALTPPVGLTCFAVKACLPQYDLKEIFAGAMPFWVVDVANVALLVAYPAIALWLPATTLPS